MRAVLERKAAALKQRSAPKLQELLEENFVYVTASGRRLRRDAYVENGTGPHGLRFQSQEIEGLDVADFGDMAIATMTLHDRFEVQGQAVAETYRSFCVFRRHGSGWLWAGGQTCVAGRPP
ncbi:MAG: nuclear transport factor 2 family protein, partial [Reyranella sp.]|nr:nuclear transport factor 2 family protein [Reyranella sp.]